MRLLTALFFCILSLSVYSFSAPDSVSQVKGKVIDKFTRKPLSNINVVTEGLPDKKAVSDSTGTFVIRNLPVGIYRFYASAIGYKSVVTSEYIISSKSPFIEIEMEDDFNMLSEVTVSVSPFRREKKAPVSMQIIGLQEIEKSPGANRDISRIVENYPGVAFTPAGYRNDLMIRGGSPGENRYYLDGIEIPNINHFGTQGASGGAIGIINADLIREVEFYTGAFPADKGNALSSVLDFSLRDGNMDANKLKLTLGASEMALSADGHIGSKTSYLVSVRQSYLQLLFKMLELPFLPRFTDAQFKIKTRFSPQHELTLLGVGGIDRMKLNLDITGEDAEYILSYLPKIEQETHTLGAVYKHYAGRHVQSVSLSHNYLNNRNIKYQDNDESNEDNLRMRLKSVEQKTVLRMENTSCLNDWTIKAGGEYSYHNYDNTSYQRIYDATASLSEYRTDLDMNGWGLFVSANLDTERWKVQAAVRSDGCDYSSSMKRMYKQISPRASVAYQFLPGWSVAASSGIYYQLPPYTALGFKANDGTYINQDLNYQKVVQYSGGVSWDGNSRWSVSLEGFLKQYSDMPLSVTDRIPLACKGNDYGVIGNERLVPTVEGRAYGAELMVKWIIPTKLNVISSLTVYRSEYRNDKNSDYIASAWDNRYILNLSGTYNLPRRWSVGAKVSYMGGAPYTPYDEQKSSLVEAWNAQGRPYYDYSRYNSERLPSFMQMDVRVDKIFAIGRYLLGVYFDIQNVTGSKYRQPDILMSTGVIENPEAPLSEQRYKMKTIKQESGSVLPTLGITFEF